MTNEKSIIGALNINDGAKSTAIEENKSVIGAPKTDLGEKSIVVDLLNSDIREKRISA